jgi:formylglycine-generating enzyme required for sulfatase activity
MIGLSAFGMAEETPRYTKTDGIVSDSKTALAWQDDYSDNGDNVKQATWSDALAYCDGLTLGGNDDWRLPNFNELYSIGDRSKTPPAIKDAFENVSSSGYWSSTTTVGLGNTDYAWCVHFNNGNDYYDPKANNYYVRCIRDGQ